MKPDRLIALALALVPLAACGGDESRGELSAEEERRLDEAGEMVNEDVFDTSPDSLVANEAEIEAIDAEAGAPAANAAANAN